MMLLQKIDFSKESHHNCPSFDRCNTNKCPLHRDFYKLQDSPEDKILSDWKKCRASKLVRMKIAKAFRLKSLGLTDRERYRLTKSLQMKKENSLQRNNHSKSLKNAIFQEVNDGGSE